ncbi:Cytosolic endo-beta-N-acetylglucosaminidase [Strongyloides ratti]|uniref:Cytosolic endo-beta-N-acetylglucosaminidase n=1 Tax=Strongyloides ratti TaxID=34506 RepID=A0A090LFX6_STRRB|nr:Cytosolic endo-beta-N-acetylglucosaminidase [Strongyloides ratti]CEF68676.1 Cytosolic endo-beta-N-acetylglucosaminidase [Strongyloides ratti]
MIDMFNFGGIRYEGCTLNDSKEDPFIITHWWNIDSFCYFSHHFISIPPKVWIDQGHAHGVKVLGTLITEYKDGFLLCNELFTFNSNIDNLIKCLVKLTKLCNFDGWLINIENPLIDGKVDQMWSFLEVLTSELKKLDEGNIVIWYDSVIDTGELKWQNELNEHNVQFFDVCDGIYLNYCWDGKKLDRSMELATPKKCKNVYVGIDIFGRKTFGGGGFNANVAMEEIKKRNMSTVLFALGWLCEAHQNTCIFRQNEKFFELIKHYLPSRSIKKLPIKTNFKNGFDIECNKTFCYANSDIQPLIHDKNNIFRETPKMKPSGGFEITFKNHEKFGKYVVWYFEFNESENKTFNCEISYEKVKGKGELIVNFTKESGETINLEKRDVTCDNILKVMFNAAPASLKSVVLSCEQGEDSETTFLVKGFSLSLNN